MLTPLRILAASLFIGVLLTACGGTRAATSTGNDPGSAPASESTATSKAQAAPPNSLASQDATPAPNVGALETAALMLDFSDGAGDSTLRLVDTTSGASVPGHEPLSLTPVGPYAYLPGGQALAMMVYASANSPLHPELVLLDIPDWTTTVVPLSLIGWPQAMAISSDGARIAVAGFGNGTNLSLVDAVKGEVLAEASVPNQVRALSFTRDGSGLMVYASNEDVNNSLSLGTPQALVLNAADLSVVWQAELAGVRDAFLPGPEYEGESHSPGAGTRYLPGVAFSPVSDTLYVVHADEDRLTSVDFTSQEVAGADIRPPLGFLERLLSLGARVAHAKVQSGTEKHIAVSPDGSLLYVTGMDNQFTKKDNGEWNLDQQALGLKVVDAASGTELLALDTQADQVAVMPDGLVLLRSWTRPLPSTEVYDPAARGIVARYGGVYQNCVPLMKGSYVLGSSMHDTMRDMQLYDPGSGRLLGSWAVDSFNAQWVSCNP